MNVAIFGATGSVGKELVAQGHDVRGFASNPAKLEADTYLHKTPRLSTDPRAADPGRVALRRPSPSKETTMTSQLIPFMTLFAAIGSGITSGLMFTFSTFMMGVLGRLPDAQGAKVMQALNVAILNPLFFLVFLGTAVLSLALAVSALLDLGKPGAAWRLAGAALYLLGVMLVTIVVNVPLNDALAAVDPAGADGARFWERYLSVWTRWNHVRTLTAIGATAALILAFRS